ncbi:hypothetical protein KGQ20_34930 [Catenulispora sp. NF23]|uniref:hypothetical protein n=1 Tax=Catenulispora pinistramenti TaxID=2705254 RepID=UPI001BAC9995|nr:hypothetical protein [Catenulispora pinistramenti]MBS2537961.1 hypothetical protein [Catenulispora pinistramenti]
MKFFARRTQMEEPAEPKPLPPRVVLDIPTRRKWMTIPASFPDDEDFWQNATEWAAEGALVVWGDFHDKGVPMPDPDWQARTARLLKAAYDAFNDRTARTSLLFFHDLNRAPIPASFNVFVAELPIKKAYRLFVGDFDPDNVQPPAVETFEYSGGASGVRAKRFTYTDREAGTVVARVVYYWRRDNVDCQLIATFVDPGEVEAALPGLDDWARNTTAYPY